MNAWRGIALRHGDVGVRPLTLADGREWKAARQRSRDWLRPWEATVPAGDESVPRTFRGMVRDLHRQAREGRTLPMAVTVSEEFAGQVTASNLVGGSARFGQIGYWIDRRFAGRGVMPVAVALLIDHCFSAIGMHRMEVAIRPENAASLRVVEKLGLHEVGFAPRYLHIDGEWRDHRLFAVTVEEVPDGLLRRYLQQLG